MVKEVLKQLGLNDKEVEVYLTVLKLGSIPASVVGSCLKIPRSTARYICQQLKKKGLFLEIEKGNTFIYSADSPDKLLYLLEQEKKALEHKEAQTNRIIGELKNMQNPYAVLPKVKFYEGLDNIKRVLDDTLTSKTDLLTYSDVAGYMKYLYEYNTQEYAPRRKELGIFEKVIIPNTKTALEYMAGYEANDYTDIVFIDHRTFPFYSEINIYDNKISYVTFSDQGHVGLIIENKEIYETHKSAFDMAWHFGKDNYQHLMSEFNKIEK